MIIRTEAVVIKKYNFRETSVICTFFSKNYGKIKCLFKGIREDPKKFASSLNLFSLNEVIFYKKRNTDLHLAGQCDLIKDFQKIRQDIKKTALVSYAAELIDSIMPAEDKNETIFSLLMDCLSSVDGHTSDPEKIIHFFQIKLLSLSGFKPHLDSCILCSGKIADNASFSVRLGGIICKNCEGRDRNAHHILKGTIASIMHVENYDWHRAMRLSLSNQVQQELSSILFNFLSAHLEKELKSYRFIHTASNNI